MTVNTFCAASKAVFVIAVSVSYLCVFYHSGE